MSARPEIRRQTRTAYRDQDPDCERTVVALRIYGDDLDPEQVSSSLGIDPTSSQRKGQIFPPNSFGRQRVAPIGGWFLSSEGVVESTDIRRHFEWLLGQLESRATEIGALRASPSVSIYISCIWWASKDGGGGFVLAPEHLQKIGELGLECDFGVAFYGASENDDPGTNIE
jgi:hypothetical protein